MTELLPAGGDTPEVRARLVQHRSQGVGSAGEPAEHGADALEVALQLRVQPQHLKDREHLAGAAQGDSEVVPASGRLPAPAAALGDVQDDAIGRPDGLVLEVASPRWPAGRRDPLVDRQGELVGVEVLEGAGARPRRRVPRSRPAPETRSSRTRLDHRGSIIENETPRAWVRHQLESTIAGIGLAGYAVGPDYLAGERVPLLVVGVWQACPTTAAEIYHDVYSGIASGALGIALYSYAHGVDSASGDGLDGFLQAAEELTTHDEPLGSVVLFGESTGEVAFEITDGATLTDEFTPYGATEPEQYDCLNLAAWDHDDQRWVVAVNSCEEPLAARLSGFTGGPEVVLPYEERVLCLDDEGAFEDDFDALGVHIYRVDGP